MVKLKLVLIDDTDQEKAVEVVSVSRVEALRLANCSYPATLGAFLIDQSNTDEAGVYIREL